MYYFSKIFSYFVYAKSQQPPRFTVLMSNTLKDVMRKSSVSEHLYMNWLPEVTRKYLHIECSPQMT